MDKNNIKNLQQLVDFSADEYENRVFVREKSGKDIVDKTFIQFRDDVKKVMAYVNTFCDSQPIHCAVSGASSYAWLISYFGIVCGGNVSVPLDAQLNEDDIADLLNRSDSIVFFYDKRFEKMIGGLKIKCPAMKAFVSMEYDLPKILESFEPKDFPVVEPSALATISYTSGTTGRSKGVMLLHSNFIDNTMCQENESTADDVLMSVLPIHHIYCFTCDILLTLRYGNVLCFNDSMMRIPQNLKLFRPTVILLVPMIAETLYKIIKNTSLSAPDIPMSEIAKKLFGGRLEIIYSGGAYLRPELQKNYLDMGISIVQGYGMTECSPRISTGSRYKISCDGDVGTIVNGCQVKIVDGEIMVKSNSVMAGYYKDSENTAETLTADGWLHTGDLGYVDGENRLFLTGRKKNLIILSNGENVSPEELENKFAGLDFISEILVYSDENIICAEIFPNKELYPDENVAARMFRETVDAINKTVPASKAIRRLRIRENDFDRTSSKKIVRNQSEKGKIIK